MTNMRLLSSAICLAFIAMTYSEFLHSETTLEAGNVEVLSEHDADLVKFTVSFELIKQPLWLAIGLNTQAKMFDTLVMIIKYDNGLVNLYNGYNQNYVTPTPEDSSLILLQQVRINEKVVLVFQRQVAFVSSVNPNVNNDLRNCYRIAIASGPLANNFTLPHSKIPQFSPNCLVIAPEKITDLPLVPYYVRLTIDMQFTTGLLSTDSLEYKELRLRIEKYISDSLNADGLSFENFQLLSLSPGSVVSVSGISLRKSDLQEQIFDALFKGSTDFLPVIKDKIFVTNSSEDMFTSDFSVTTSESDMKFLNTSTTDMDKIDTTTPITEMTTNEAIMMNNSTSKENVLIDQFEVKFIVNEQFTEKLTDKTSSEYNLFVSRLDSYIKSGFSASNVENTLIDWNLESLSKGSVIALTNMNVADVQDEDKDNFLRKIIESGDKDILPVKSIDIKISTSTEIKTLINETTTLDQQTTTKKSSTSAAAIVIPIVSAIVLIIVLIAVVCIFRKRRKARNSYILQTTNRNHAFDAGSRISEIPRNLPRFSSEDDLSIQDVKNIHKDRLKSANDLSASLNSQSNKDKREYAPPNYSLTDKSTENFKEIPLENDSKEKIELKEINLNENENTNLNYDTSDIDDIRPNYENIIKRTNNPLFQMDE